MNSSLASRKFFLAFRRWVLFNETKPPVRRFHVQQRRTSKWQPPVSIWSPEVKSKLTVLSKDKTLKWVHLLPVKPADTTLLRAILVDDRLPEDVEFYQQGKAFTFVSRHADKLETAIKQIQASFSMLNGSQDLSLRLAVIDDPSIPLETSKTTKLDSIWARKQEKRLEKHGWNEKAWMLVWVPGWIDVSKLKEKRLAEMSNYGAVAFDFPVEEDGRLMMYEGYSTYYLLKSLGLNVADERLESVPNRRLRVITSGFGQQPVVTSEHLEAIQDEMSALDAEQGQHQDHVEPLTTPQTPVLQYRPSAQEEQVQEEQEAPDATDWEPPTPMSEDLRPILSTMTSSVVVITACQKDGNGAKRYRGITVSSFSAVAMEPKPHISFNIKLPSRTYDAFAESGNVCIHILAGNSTGATIASAFTQRYDDPYQAFEVLKDAGAQLEQSTPDSPPQIHWENGVAAWLSCGGFDSNKSLDVGDHKICVFSVKDVQVAPEHDPTQTKPSLALAYGLREYRVDSSSNALRDRETADESHRMLVDGPQKHVDVEASQSTTQPTTPQTEAEQGPARTQSEPEDWSQSLGDFLEKSQVADWTKQDVDPETSPEDPVWNKPSAAPVDHEATNGSDTSDAAVTMAEDKPQASTDLAKSRTLDSILKLSRPNEDSSQLGPYQPTASGDDYDAIKEYFSELKRPSESDIASVPISGRSSTTIKPKFKWDRKRKPSYRFHKWLPGQDPDEESFVPITKQADKLLRVLERQVGIEAPPLEDRAMAEKIRTDEMARAYPDSESFEKLRRASGRTYGDERLGQSEEVFPALDGIEQAKEMLSDSEKSERADEHLSALRNSEQVGEQSEVVEKPKEASKESGASERSAEASPADMSPDWTDRTQADRPVTASRIAAASLAGPLYASIHRPARQSASTSQSQYHTLTPAYIKKVTRQFTTSRLLGLAEVGHSVDQRPARTAYRPFNAAQEGRQQSWRQRRSKPVVQRTPLDTVDDAVVQSLIQPASSIDEAAIASGPPPDLAITVDDFLCHSFENKSYRQRRLRKLRQRSRESAETLDTKRRDGTLTEAESIRLEKIITRIERWIAQSLGRYAAVDLGEMLDKGMTVKGRIGYIESTIEKGLQAIFEEAQTNASRLRDKDSDPEHDLERDRILQPMAFAVFKARHARLAEQEEILRNSLVRLRALYEDDDRDSYLD